MADYGFNTQLTPNIPQTSLSDMLNIARGAQAYQQAQQLNPLQLQALQQQVEQARQMNPELLQQQKQLTASGGIDLEVKKRANEERNAVIPFLQNPANYTRDDGSIDVNKASQAIRKLAPQTADNYIKQLTDYAKAETEVQSNKLALTQGERAIIAPVLGVMGNMGVTDPVVINKNLEQLKKQFPDNPSLHKTVDAYKGIFGLDQKGGPHIAQTLLQESNSLLTPAQLTPKEGPTVSGQPTTRNPVTGAVTVSPIAGETSTSTSGVTPNMMGKDALSQPTPTRYKPPNVLHAETPEETADRASGTTYATNLLTRVADLSQTERTLQDIMSTAQKLKAPSSGTFEWWDKVKNSQPGRYLNIKIDQLMGDPTYLELSKNMARAQIEAIKSRGGSMDSVAGQQLEKAANGDYTYPPDALIDIAQRTFADLTDTKLRAQALQKYHTLHGSANNNSFLSDWAKNSDNRVFQAIAVDQQVQDPAVKKQALDSILGAKPQLSQYKSTEQYNNALNAWKTQRATFVKKYDNIQKLVETGTLR
jgi:hypothetical protein